jgi:hypothetical protein
MRITLVDFQYRKLSRRLQRPFPALEILVGKNKRRKEGRKGGRERGREREGREGGRERRKEEKRKASKLSNGVARHHEASKGQGVQPACP